MFSFSMNAFTAFLICLQLERLGVITSTDTTRRQTTINSITVQRQKQNSAGFLGQNGLRVHLEVDRKWHVGQCWDIESSSWCDL